MLLILIILPATPFPLFLHSTPLLFPHAIPLIPQHSTPLLFPHAIPLIPQHSTPLLFPHAIPLIPQHFHTAPIPTRHSPYPPAFPHRSYSRTPFPLSPSIPHRSCSRTPDTAHSPVTDPVEASAHPMLDGDSYLFAMASMASVKESRLLFIDFLLSLCLER